MASAILYAVLIGAISAFPLVPGAWVALERSACIGWVPEVKLVHSRRCYS